ncbi:Phosphoglucomutase-2 [Trichinella pseudospiralis]|uniref:Phosphoglucomutase-2 n=1 Tax=Trichinella pseudospiralis TaxID=6337 RepID=A0A0V1JVA7_TRIPS|nr:Phosphoglucomutase-2 [Trichinella pseudospiralis]KRZ38898.1 Phosphoglucomutase-2 [Trichinella pseudospiralis]
MSIVYSGDGMLDSLLEQWLKWDKNQETRAEVLRMIQMKDFDKLRTCMQGRLGFGTAGIRGEMGVGFRRLNDLVIIQIAQGLCSYMLKVNNEAKKQLSVVIGCDARHNSRRFADLSANVFNRKGIQVYYFSNIVPTPLVSYAVAKYNADAGVMVTASHNPKNDNGYKVYWNNAAQIISPVDENILKCIDENLEPWQGCWDADDVRQRSNCTDILQECWSAYLQEATRFRSPVHQDGNFNCSLKFTYSAFHGVGSYYCPYLLQKFGVPEQNIVMVEEQAQPDPDFPTVPFPNPEEGASVLQLSIQTAERNNSSLIFATDPDADRFQLAEQQADKKWYIFTGNEMGALLSWWMYYNCKNIHKSVSSETEHCCCCCCCCLFICYCSIVKYFSEENMYIINSVVSSKFARTLANKEGIKYEETLTGFKWMANRASELNQQGKVVLLAWEESIGFMPGVALDKDGVMTAAIFADYASHLYSKGMNFLDKLHQLYTSYGLHLNFNSYLICPDPSQVKQLFDDLRNSTGNSDYPTHCGKYKIKHVRDLCIGYDSSMLGNKPILPWGPSNFMITFFLENGCTFTIRGSGTEPKIKYYIEIVQKPTESNMDDAKQLMEYLKSVIVSDFFRPQKYNLLFRK